MNNADLANVFNKLVDKYVEDYQKSLIRNEHMNDYDGEAFNTALISEWLHQFVNLFATNYKGGWRSGDVIMAAVEVAKGYLRTDGLDYKASTTKAIMVDYLNYVAGNHCCMDLALYTSDMG